MTIAITSDISYIQKIQESMPPSAWHELNWYLLNHKNVDLRSAYKLYQSDDADYNKWLETHSLNTIEPNKTIEEILLAYVSDYINVIDVEQDGNIQEHFDKKELDMEFLKQKDELEKKIDDFKERELAIEAEKRRLTFLKGEEKEKTEAKIKEEYRKIQEEKAQLVKEEMEKLKAS